MDKNILEWLREGPAWVKYAVELQLLGLEPDVTPVLQDSAIQKIIARLKSPESGIPALKSGGVRYTEAGKAYWDLFFLADIGLSARQAGLEDEAEQIFRFQQADGSFVIPPNVRDNYYCMSAILLTSLAAMDYRGDPRMEKYIHAVLGGQMPVGGWECYGEGYGTACPMADLNCLMLLGRFYPDSKTLNNAVGELLSHWEIGDNREGFGVGKRFRSLQYPAVKYGILRVLDVLSLFPYALRSQPFRDMLKFVQSKARDGKYYAESVEPAYSDFDFGQTAEPSRWITFLVNRIEKRT